MNMSSTRRKGIALVIALVAIVVIGALIAGAFFASTQEYRIGRNSLIQESAHAASEHGNSYYFRNWNNGWVTGLKDGDTLIRVDASNGVKSGVMMTKLNMNTYWVVSRGRTGVGGGVQTAAQRRTGMLVRIERPRVRVAGAITTASKTDVTGSGSISGTDINPPGWGECDETGTQKAGLVNDNSADVASAGTCSGFACVSGSPKVLEDASAGHDTTYTKFGDEDWASLTAGANYTILVPSGGLTYDKVGPTYKIDGSCDKANAKNWGDQLRNAVTPGKCEDYFPVVHFKGTGLVTLANGRGQGLILIDGSLKLAGNFEFTGLIIARGNTIVEGIGNKIWGGLMAMNEGCVIGGSVKTCNSVAGSAHVQYSKCAINSAFTTKAKPVMATRGWSDMF